MTDGTKWTRERLDAMRATIEAARAFVRCADDFVPRDGSRFYPGALDEHYVALSDAMDADGRAWDGCGVHHYSPSSPNSSASPCAVCSRGRDDCERAHAPASTV